MTHQEWTELMSECFPVETDGGDYEVDFCGDASEDGGFKAVMRLYAFEDGGLRDVKEQHVAAGSADSAGSSERYQEFLKAWAAVFATIPAGALDSAMPNELLCADVLELKASNFDEFAKALSAKARLGRFL